MIGYGLMGRAHTNAFRQVSQFFKLEHRPVLKAICGRDGVKAAEFAANWGYESVETDWKAMIARPDIDLIDIAATNNVHAEIAIAAAKAGKMILCEKPLSMNTAEGHKMVEAVESAGVLNTVWYNYRRVPAVTLASATAVSVALPNTT
jgi:predicted dehydrogenase